MPRNAQPNGPVQSPNGQPLARPLARGRTLIVAPEEDRQRIRIESRNGELELLDGRSAHNNGWYIVREIWGAGWQIQERGVRQYFFHKGWPAVTSTDSYINALNFVLGVHPGENTSSFVSGVGSQSATTASLNGEFYPACLRFEGNRFHIQVRAERVRDTDSRNRLNGTTENLVSKPASPPRALRLTKPR